MATVAWNNNSTTGAISGKATTISVNDLSGTSSVVASAGSVSFDPYSNIGLLTSLTDYDLLTNNISIDVGGAYYSVLAKWTDPGPVYKISIDHSPVDGITPTGFTLHVPNENSVIEIAEVYNIEQVVLEQDAIDVTFHSNSPYSNVIPNTYNIISFNLDVNFVPTNYDIYKKYSDGYVDVTQEESARGHYLRFSIDTDLNIKGYRKGKFEFFGYVTSCGPVFAYDDRVTHTLGILVDGNVVHTDSSQLTY